MQNPVQNPKRFKRHSLLAAGTILTLAAGVPQAASAGVASPDIVDSPASRAILIQYLVVAALGLIFLLVLGRKFRNAIRREPAIAENGEKSSAMALGHLAALLATLLVIGGGVGLTFADTAPESAAGTSADYKPAPLEDAILKSGPAVDPPAGPSMSVQANGQQYLWRYSYSGKSATYTYHDLVIPVGVTVLVDVTSSDVTHSWWIPGLGATIEAIPGYINRGWIRADEKGVYHGASTTISGTNYQSMTTRVIALPQKEFDAWIAGNAKGMTEAMSTLGAEVKAQADAVQPEVPAAQQAAPDHESGGHN